MTTRVPLNSLRYRPLPPKRGKFSYLLYGVWGFSIIEGDEELTAVPDESKFARKIPWSAVTAVVFKISPFGSSSIFFELHKMPYRYLFFKFDNEFAPGLEKALKTLSSHVRAQDVPDVLYSEVVAGYGPELFYSRPIRLAGMFIMQIVVFVGLLTGTLHMLSGILHGQPVTTSNPITDSLRDRVQVPVESFVTRVVWPFVRAHYLILSPVLLLSSFFVVPFLGIYLFLGAAWTVAFHASFLIIVGKLLDNANKALSMGSYGWTFTKNLLSTRTKVTKTD